MRKYHKLTPEGTRDLLFEVCAARRNVEGRLRALFEGRGYLEVMTPGVEFYDVFAGASRYFPQESLYKSIDRKGRLLVMRPDTTIPIARLCATKLQNYPYPVRLYYNQNIYRMNQLMNGDSHEIMQMGLEVLGAPEGRAELEMLALSAQSLSDCGFADFRLELGHIGVLKALLAKLPADLEDKERLTVLIAQKNYGELAQLTAQWPTEEAAVLLGKLPRLFGDGTVLADCRALFADYPELLAPIAELEKIYDALAALGLAEKVIIDLALVDQADYYTGLVFRGYIASIGEAVLSGGRYDGLLADFGLDWPAIGFGVRVDLLAEALLKEQFALKKPQALIFAQAGCATDGLKLAQELNAQGISCQFSLNDTLSGAEQEARQRGIGKIYCVGPTVTVKEVEDL